MVTMNDSDITARLSGPEPDALKVLVVDDDPGFRTIMKRHLDAVEELQIEPFFVADGRRALSFAQARMPQVVLLDYNLPDMNGIELLQALRALPNGERAMVIVLTGEGDETIATELMKCGASDYVRKDDLEDGKKIETVIRKAKVQHDAHLVLHDQSMRLGRYEYLLDSVDDAIFIVDADSAVPYEMNLPARECIANSIGSNSTVQTVLGVSPFPDDQEGWYRYIDNLRGAGTSSREAELQRGGVTIPVEIRERLMWHRNNHYVISIARDISEFKALEKQLLALAVVDPLTGMPNRRSYDHKVQDEWRRVRRDKPANPLGLLIMDIDYFKRYNDALGHVPGDNCLKRVANIITECVSRDTDLACRIGGEEFAVVLHGSDEEGCKIVARRIQQRLSRSALPHPDSDIAKIITLSIGIAIADSERVTTASLPDVLHRAADAALYEAKEAGRNCIYVEGQGVDAG